MTYQIMFQISYPITIASLAFAPHQGLCRPQQLLWNQPRGLLEVSMT